jgi:hypothetical protein
MKTIKRLICQPQKSFRSLTEVEIGYLAGLYDGEGCFRLEHQRNPEASCSNTNSRLCNIAKNYGGVISVTKHKKPRKPLYQWTLRGNLLKDFLEIVAPKMILRGDQALLLLASFEYKENKEKLKEIDLELKRLKQYEHIVPEELRTARSLLRKD